MAHQLYPTDPAPAGAFDVRWRHFHPQLSLEQQQRASPEADVDQVEYTAGARACAYCTRPLPRDMSRQEHAHAFICPARIKCEYARSSRMRLWNIRQELAHSPGKERGSGSRDHCVANLYS